MRHDLSLGAPLTAPGRFDPPPVPTIVPPDEEILAKASRENFPVASRLLPERLRERLLAIYGLARLIDDVGDEGLGDRLAVMAWLEAELERAAAGHPAVPVVARAVEAARSAGGDIDQFRRLIEANRVDQQVSRYQTFEQLLGYCELSANPVGRLVLAVFGATTPEREARSDLVCTGLQLVEHWQDVGEDARAGRVYLPLEDLGRFEVSVDDLSRPAASPAVQALVLFEVARTRRFLAAGAALVSSLDGPARWAVAGFVAGGWAALDAIADAHGDVLSIDVHPSRPRMVLGMLALIAGRGVAA